MADGPKKLLPFPTVSPLVKGAVVAVGIMVGACDGEVAVDAGFGSPPMVDAGPPIDGAIGPMPPPPMPAPMVDAGPPDAGSDDAGSDDAGAEDAGPGDGGLTPMVDAGDPDASTGFDSGVIAPMPPPEPDGGIVITPHDGGAIPPMPAPDPDGGIIIVPPMPAPEEDAGVIIAPMPAPDSDER